MVVGKNKSRMIVTLNKKTISLIEKFQRELDKEKIKNISDEDKKRMKHVTKSDVVEKILNEFFQEKS